MTRRLLALTALVAADFAIQALANCEAATCEAVVLEGGFKEGSKPGNVSPAGPVANVDVTEALLLIGIICLVMGMFYFLNCKDKSLVKNTWSLISTVISIFCAVLLYSVLSAILGTLGVDVSSGWGAVVVLLLMILLQAELFYFGEEQRHIAVLSIGTLTGHIAGFAALDTFGDLQEDGIFSIFGTSWWLSFVYVIIVSILLIGLCRLFGVARAEVAKSQHGDLDGEWEDQCEDTENDVCALSIGFFISRATRYAISGTLPPVEGMPMGKTIGECVALMLTAILYMGFMVGCALAKGASKSKAMERIADRWSDIFGMASAWQLLFFGQWGYWLVTSEAGLFGNKSMMTAKIAMALYNSVVVMMLILATTLFADHFVWAEKASKSVITALGLAMGFGWEKCFDLAVDNAGDYLAPEEAHSCWAKILMCLLLVAIVMPAWTHYILSTHVRPDLLKKQDEEDTETGEDEDP